MEIRVEWLIRNLLFSVQIYGYLKARFGIMKKSARKINNIDMKITGFFNG